MHPLTHAEAIARIGPRPPGDVAGMRALAARIRGVAARLGTGLNIRLDNWLSDRAREAKASIDQALHGASTAADELAAAAAILEREAADIATEQARWAGRYTALTGTRPIS
jgi:hypothetical protein